MFFLRAGTDSVQAVTKLGGPGMGLGRYGRWGI